MEKFANISALFKLYNTISKQKLSQVLGIKLEKFNNLLNDFLSRRNINFDNKSDFYLTILKPLYSNLSETRITIENGQIEVDEPEEKSVDYAAEYL